MFVPFSTLPAASRIWIFQASRPFAQEELPILEQTLRSFTDEWSVHGSPLNASFRIEYHRFIVLAADESRQSASGCSIDSSVRILKEAEHGLGIQLLDRSQVAFKQGDEVFLVPIAELRQKFQNGVLAEDTLVFNNLVSTKAEFEKNWVVPAAASWVRRYIPGQLAKVK